MTTFTLDGPLPTGRTLIEASAGTGKTYSIAALLARYIAGDIVGPGHDLAEGVNIDEILVVTYTRAAASELRDRIRGTLRHAVAHLEGRERDEQNVATSEPWMHVFDTGSRRVRQRRAARLREALARFDEAVITTIHGFCQQALAQSGLRAGADLGVELVEDDRALIAEVARDVLIDRLADEPLALSTDSDDCPPPQGGRGVRSPAKVEGYIINTVRAVLSNPAARCEPGPDSGGFGGAWASVVGDVVRQVGDRQLVRRQIGYDRLITDLRGLLADPVGGRQLADQLANRYRLVLVDEFQDTDRIQWEIFHLAFGRHRLVTVGDPKQAIYRFRGADVHAYLEAVDRSERATLATNHRSDQQLLDAVGLLFNGATLGHRDIAFSRVDAAPGAPHNAMGAEAAFQLHVVADDPTIPRTRRGLESGAVQRIVLTDVASRVRTLLDEATITDTDGDARRVEPHHIAVLVPSQRRAAETAAVLRDWAIPSVRARTGSVLDTDAAIQWRLLLAGLASPTRARVARAAGLSWFFDHDPVRLTDDHDGGPDAFETPMATLQRRLAVLADRLRTGGVGALYEQLRAESGVMDVVLARPNGDRHLTDLDHIADLLVAATHGGDAEPVRVQEALDSLIASGDQTEATMRRIESDAEAVQITTIHSAKGLEFPIVLVPFAYVERSMLGRPYVFNDNGRRVIDVASWVAWADDGTEGGRSGKAGRDQRKALAREEIDGDSLRLLYVALTRAKHRVEVWWAPMAGAATSAFGRLLLDRVGAGPVLNSPIKAPYEKLGADVGATRAQIDAIVTASNGTIASFDVPLQQPVRRPLPESADAVVELDLADHSVRPSLLDPAWRSWSFTAISRAIERDQVWRRATSARPTEPPAVGGADEPADPEDGSVGRSAESRVALAGDRLNPASGQPMPAGGQPMPAGGQPEMALADTVGGTTFGTMVHEVLEQVDFTSRCLAADVMVLTAVGSQRAGLSLDSVALAGGLVAAIETPLGPLFDGRPLRDIAPADRLAELTFDLAIGRDGEAAVSARLIGEVLTATLDADDPLRPYGEQLATDSGTLVVTGWLNGSIDGVFRVRPSVDADPSRSPGGAFDRYVVVDYKSNRLHVPGSADPLESYRPDRLVGAMTHSHYPLQALLYDVALHRYLRWRLGALYDPDRHLGGVAYLFVRGMVGPSTPTVDGVPFGVFSWRPPTGTVLAIDDVLSGAAAVHVDAVSPEGLSQST